MSEELSEYYAEWREAKKVQKQRRRDKGTKDILALKGQGYFVLELTPYHFRVNGVLDLFPTSRRYHALETDVRDNYQDALEIAQKVVGKSV